MLIIFNVKKFEFCRGGGLTLISRSMHMQTEIIDIPQKLAFNFFLMIQGFKLLNLPCICFLKQNSLFCLERCCVLNARHYAMQLS